MLSYFQSSSDWTDNVASWSLDILSFLYIFFTRTKSTKELESSEDEDLGGSPANYTERDIHTAIPKHQWCLV